jgi:hypothetical protein
LLWPPRQPRILYTSKTEKARAILCNNAVLGGIFSHRFLLTICLLLCILQMKDLLLTRREICKKEVCPRKG